jgi:hypothetical protein
MASKFAKALAVKTVHIMHSDPLATAIDAEIQEVRNFVKRVEAEYAAGRCGAAIGERARALLSKLEI